MAAVALAACDGDPVRDAGSHDGSLADSASPDAGIADPLDAGDGLDGGSFPSPVDAGVAPCDGSARCAPDPGAVALGLESTTVSSLSVEWTEVDDGTGNPATYALRYAEDPTEAPWWGSALPTETVVGGTAIGAAIRHTIAGLRAGTRYEVQVVAYRGTLGVDAVYGPLSNPVEGTTADGGSSHLNEPAGFSVISERSFSTANEDGWVDNTSSSRYAAGVTDTGAPRSPSLVGRATFPAESWIDGSSPCGGCARRSVTPTTSLYFAFWFRVSTNWWGHDASGVNKILYLTDNSYDGGGDPGPFIIVFGQRDGPLRLQARLQGLGAEECGASANMPGNLGVGTEILRGQWYLIEGLTVMNTGTNQDGEIHMWIDGVKTHEYTNCRIEDSTSSDHRWDNIRWTPVYGGVGGSAPPAEQHQYIDHFYISGP